jgi:putative SOS response-associated peptidase YedK
MCGRFLNKLPAAEIARIFRSSNPLPNYPARYNIAPTDQMLTVRFNAKTQERTVDARRWGRGASMNARLRMQLGVGGSISIVAISAPPI